MDVCVWVGGCACVGGWVDVRMCEWVGLHMCEWVGVCMCVCVGWESIKSNCKCWVLRSCHSRQAGSVGS